MLECYGPHCDRHSFPTRRSSDLHAEHRNRDDGGIRRIASGAERLDRRKAGKRVRGCGHASLAAIEALRAGRSEEHTSELQSLTNLVCRLLLEKKNIKHSIQSSPI